MPKYIPNVLQQFTVPHKPTSTPFPLSATTSSTLYKNAAQKNTSQLLNKQETTQIQQINSCLLYYAHALDNTPLVALNTINQTQAKPTITTKNCVIIY